MKLPEEGKFKWFGLLIYYPYFSGHLGELHP
jgi:hypothetical protein